MVSAPSKRDLLAELQRWYLAQCDGEWEHSYGVKVSTLENPGWSVEVNLEGTPLESRPFAPVGLHRYEDDWVVARREGARFRAYCGPLNLDDALAYFLDWAGGDAGE